jgi:ABC-type transport system involved in multi-copper enzyme maturation permease subunit
MEKAFKVLFYVCAGFAIVLGLSGSTDWWIPIAGYSGFSILMIALVFALSAATDRLFKPTHKE